MDRIPIVRRAILADRPMVASIGWTALAIVVPTAVRWVIDRGEAGIPFVTYFPAVLLATVFLGWRYGTVTAFLSAIIANRLLRTVPLLFYVSATDFLLILLFGVACSVIVVAGEAVRRLVRQQEDARIREDLLKRELVHRMKNLFTIIQSLAALTARNSEPGEFIDKFGGRLLSLESANELLGSTASEGAEVGTLVERAVEPFRNDGNFAIAGPPYTLPTNAVVALALVLHELCTNAVKYGALSVPEGKVKISWQPVEEDLRIDWIETGGPPVEPPTRQGLGSLLLRARNALKDVKLNFEPDGVRCSILIAAES